MATSTGRTIERATHTFAVGDVGMLRPGAPVGLVGTTVEVLEVLSVGDAGEQRLRVRLHADGSERACWAAGLAPVTKL